MKKILVLLAVGQVIKVENLTAVDKLPTNTKK
jgi:hypothetical protein